MAVPSIWLNRPFYEIKAQQESFWEPPLGGKIALFHEREKMTPTHAYATGADMVSFSKDGNFVAAKATFSEIVRPIRLWDLSAAKELPVRKDNVLPLSFSPDGKTVAAVTKEQEAIDPFQPGTIQLIDIKSGKGTSLKGKAFSLVFSPDGKTLVSEIILDFNEGKYRPLVVWNVATGKRLTTLKGSEELYRGISSNFRTLIKSFSPDSKTLAAAGAAGSLRLWNVATGAQICSLKGHQREITSLLFSPNGKYLVSLSGAWGSGRSEEGTIKLWDVAKRKAIATLKAMEPALVLGSRSNVRYVPHSLLATFRPDGKILATAGHDNTIQLWHTETGKELATLKGHTSIVSSLAFTPDGRSLISSSLDHTVRLWDLSALAGQRPKQENGK